jgi:hypothetical protein
MKKGSQAPVEIEVFLMPEDWRGLRRCIPDLPIYLSKFA